MKPASEALTPTEKAEVAKAIRDAEAKTSAEIVVVLATRSGRYDRAEDLFAILLGLVAVSLAWVLGQDVEPEWGDRYRIALGLVPLLLIFLATFVAGAFLATWFPSLARPFIPRDQMLDEMRRTAGEAFHRFRVHRTAEGTGVLIYVSLLEHLVWVVGDEKVGEAIPDAVWQPVKDAIVEGFKRGRPAAGLREAITMAGDRLAEPFPLTPDQPNANRLTNELQFID